LGLYSFPLYSRFNIDRFHCRYKSIYKTKERKKELYIAIYFQQEIKISNITISPQKMKKKNMMVI
jgi:hypothetical protein